jgi:hypothetical protein
MWSIFDKRLDPCSRNGKVEKSQDESRSTRSELAGSSIPEQVDFGRLCGRCVKIISKKKKGQPWPDV